MFTAFHSNTKSTMGNTSDKNDDCPELPMMFYAVDNPRNTLHLAIMPVDDDRTIMVAITVREKYCNTRNI